MSLQDPLNTDERDWSAPTRSGRKVHICRGCGTILADGDKFQFFNGWPWCTEPCYREISELAIAGTVDAASEEEFYNRVRR